MSVTTRRVVPGDSDNEIFELLFEYQPWSGCAKKQVVAGTFDNGVFYLATNRCNFEGSSCPRIDLPSGIGYDLCVAEHAEARLFQNRNSDGVLWIVGHYYMCEPCAYKAKSKGVKEIRIREYQEST